MRIVFVALITVAACSGASTSGEPVDAGVTGPTPAYWGLEDDLCLHFNDKDGRERYTIEIEQDEVTVTGKPTWKLIHRFQGQELRSEWLQLVDETLVLHRRQNAAEKFGDQPTLYRYTPPPVFLKKGLALDDTAETKTVANTSGGGRTAPENVDVTFVTAAQLIDTVTVGGAPFEATKYTLTVQLPAASQVDRLWFAENKGIVRYDPRGTDLGELTLAKADKIAPGTYCFTE